jgi:dihydroorotate dehydrogenase
MTTFKMSFYDSVIRPILFKLPTETAHELGLNALKFGLNSSFFQKRFAEKFDCREFGELERFGLKFKNPFGMAAGFDKNGVAANQLCALGFGFVEVGTVTLRPQEGNPRPRLFRLPTDEALINRAGFNNDGAPAVVERLKKSRPADCVLGVNIGKNKDVPNEEATRITWPVSIWRTKSPITSPSTFPVRTRRTCAICNRRTVWKNCSAH